MSSSAARKRYKIHRKSISYWRHCSEVTLREYVLSGSAYFVTFRENNPTRAEGARYELLERYWKKYQLENDVGPEARYDEFHQTLFKLQYGDI